MFTITCLNRELLSTFTDLDKHNVSYQGWQVLYQSQDEGV